MNIEIEGVRPSAEIRAGLAAAGEPVLLAFSCGKDALASWLALRDSGVERVVPYYLYYIPGLRFVEESLARFESELGTRILRYPHPSLYRWLNSFVFQPPERLAVIEAANMPEPTYEQVVGFVKSDEGLPASTWVADGVRAADSIVRRVSIKTHGAMKPKSRKVSVIWDWRKATVMSRIERSGIALPPDYEWFGRSFDGIDYRFLEPLSRYAPDDYQRVLEWFPLADLELVRHAI
ncbi:MAG TPA: hypothetical protein PLQ23_11640 [Dermatophilaceae bacterium]|nr:hypothetical protein [Dermatophilaceae bacterium]